MKKHKKVTFLRKLIASKPLKTLVFSSEYIQFLTQKPLRTINNQIKFCDVKKTNSQKRKILK